MKFTTMDRPARTSPRNEILGGAMVPLVTEGKGRMRGDGEGVGGRGSGGASSRPYSII
jgi:hypothetical protein